MHLRRVFRSCVIVGELELCVAFNANHNNTWVGSMGSAKGRGRGGGGGVRLKFSKLVNDSRTLVDDCRNLRYIDKILSRLSSRQNHSTTEKFDIIMEIRQASFTCVCIRSVDCHEPHSQKLTVLARFSRPGTASVY